MTNREYLESCLGIDPAQIEFVFESGKESLITEKSYQSDDTPIEFDFETWLDHETNQDYTEFWHPTQAEKDAMIIKIRALDPELFPQQQPGETIEKFLARVNAAPALTTPPGLPTGVACPVCEGSGKLGFPAAIDCHHCNGSGRMTLDRG